MDPSEIKEAFECFDSDKSGKISSKKLGSALRCLGIPVSNDEINGYTAGLKTIDFNVFQSIVSKANAVKRLSVDQIVASTSSIFLSDSGNTIDTQDLKLTLVTVGEKLTDEEIDEILQNADFDKNGNIPLKNFNELVNIP